MERKNSESSSVGKRPKASKIPKNFVETPFCDRAQSKKASELRSVLNTDINYYLATKVTKWKNEAIDDLMSVLTMAHVIDADDAVMMGVFYTFSDWAISRQEFCKAMGC
jgi:hypothetical protein